MILLNRMNQKTNLMGTPFDSTKAGNALNHGFYERHNFEIQTDEGRDVMIADLEELHKELFQVWRIASGLTTAMAELVAKFRNDLPTEG